jgi:hypothetical protein
MAKKPKKPGLIAQIRQARATIEKAKRLQRRIKKAGRIAKSLAKPNTAHTRQGENRVGKKKKSW